MTVHEFDPELKCEGSGKIPVVSPIQPTEGVPLTEGQVRYIADLMSQTSKEDQRYHLMFAGALELTKVLIKNVHHESYDDLNKSPLPQVIAKFAVKTVTSIDRELSMFLPLLFILLFPIGTVFADELSECKRLATKYDAKPEYKLWDGTRVDLLSPTHAIEVDWAEKWAEGIGQALYYGSVTGKRPGVILLIKDAEKEKAFCYRLQTVCVRLGIDYWFENVPERDQTQALQTKDYPRLPPPIEIIPAPSE